MQIYNQDFYCALHNKIDQTIPFDNLKILSYYLESDKFSTATRDMK